MEGFSKLFENFFAPFLRVFVASSKADEDTKKVLLKVEKVEDLYQASVWKSIFTLVISLFGVSLIYYIVKAIKNYKGSNKNIIRASKTISALSVTNSIDLKKLQHSIAATSDKEIVRSMVELIGPDNYDEINQALLQDQMIRRRRVAQRLRITEGEVLQLINDLHEIQVAHKATDVHKTIDVLRGIK